MRHVRRPTTLVCLIGCGCAMLVGGVGLFALVGGDSPIVAALHEPKAEHLDQMTLLNLVKTGHADQAFDEAFETGDELFETEFNALDGVGANVGDGSRFTRVPRADLTGPGQWATHLPRRATGPNAITCNGCHVQLFDDGSGSAVGNVHRDPLHSGNLRQFIQRNTPHTFALGAVQRLAEEMTGELQQARDQAGRQACSFGSASLPLSAKGIAFGSIAARRTATAPCVVTYNTANVAGVSPDLIVRPFQWKGSVATVRAFNTDAANNEIGMQPVETTGDNVDGDGDGVTNELTIGDITALSVYLASQPRPTTKLELAQYGLIDPLDASEVAAIGAGARVFANIGCASCHVPRLVLNNPIFTEPSRNPAYRDAVFPAGQDPVSRGVDPANPITIDLTRDQPDNVLKDASGNLIARMGSLARNGRGGAFVDNFGDLKRHNMGAKLAESIDEVGTGPSTFLTRNLWGVGSTAPYLHDGRATTLTEAILEHGGEAAASRAAFGGRPLAEQQALVAFLDNLVLFKITGDELIVRPPRTVRLIPLFRFRQ